MHQKYSLLEDIIYVIYLFDRFISLIFKLRPNRCKKTENNVKNFAHLPEVFIQNIN